VLAADKNVQIFLCIPRQHLGLLINKTVIDYAGSRIAADRLFLFPLELQGEVNREETRVMGLLCGESCMILTSVDGKGSVVIVCYAISWR